MTSRIINKLTVVAVLVFGAGLALANSPSGNVQKGMRSVSLSWAAPGERTDGSLVRHGDIVGYRIYIGQPAGSYAQAVDIDNPQVTEYTVRGLEKGEYRFAVTALDIFGNESPMSEELFYTVQ